MLKYEMTSDAGCYRGGVISASVQIQDDDNETSGDEFSDASQMGSSLTIKYKGARSPLSSAAAAAAAAAAGGKRCPTPAGNRDPSSVPLTSQTDDPSTCSSSASSQRSSDLMAPITFKDKKLSTGSDSEQSKDGKNGGGKGRTICLGLMGFLSVAVVAGVGLGALYFSSARNVLWMKSAQASSSLTAENDQLSLKETDGDAPSCRTVSPGDYHSGLFTFGYDVTRARPLHKKLFDTPAGSRAALRDDDGDGDGDGDSGGTALLHECHLLNGGECQLSAHSKVIDSLSAYYEWIGDRLAFAGHDGGGDVVGEQGVGGASHAALATSSHDRDLLAVQADLMSGFVIVVSSLSCPMWNATRSGRRPRLDPKFVQQLALMADEDAALELLEDFGTHYAQEAIIGGRAVVLYSMDRKSIERLKAKNVSLSVQASTASLYLYSRSNTGVNFSEESAELALDFLSFAKTQLFDDASEMPIPILGSTNDGQLIQSALKTSGIISMKVRPIEELFDQLPFNSAKFIDYWHRIRSVFCGRLLTPRTSNCYGRPHSGSVTAVTEVSHFGNKKGDTLNMHVLSLVSVGTNGTNTVYLRASWGRCVELCREDPLCSSVTVCTTEGSPHRGPSVGCPVDFGASNCALHRQQDFHYGTVSPGLSTLIPIRKDLRPITLRGFAVHGHALISSKQVTDLASCSRLCARTPDCRIVSFSQHSTGHKSCRLYHNMTTGELRVQGHSTVVFMMATFGPCFTSEEVERGVCPAHAECSTLYGMCVCPSGYRKSESGCVAPDRINDQIEEPHVKKVHHSKKHRSHSANNLVVTSSTTPAVPATDATATTEETSTATTTTTTTTIAATSTAAKTPVVVHTRLQTSSGSPGTKPSTENYYIRGVFLAPESSAVTSKPTSTTYKPWQMRFGIGPPIGLPSKQSSAADGSPPGSEISTAMRLVSHESSKANWNPRG